MAKDVKQAHETEVFRAFIEAGRSDHQGGGVWFHVEPVAVALLKAHKAGVNVRVVVDKRNATARYTAATVLANQGVQVRADYRYAIVHDKFIVVDGGYGFAAGGAFVDGAAVSPGDDPPRAEADRPGNCRGENGAG